MRDIPDAEYDKLSASCRARAEHPELRRLTRRRSASAASLEAFPQVVTQAMLSLNNGSPTTT